MAEPITDASAGRRPETSARAGTGPTTDDPAVRVSGADIDLAAAEEAATRLLTALGVDLDDESVRGTPARMARSFAELLTPRKFRLTTFPNDEGYDELVLARAIPVRSVCEHHLLPFVGTATVGYLPGDRILGLSKLARVVELFSRRPQVQERMTIQIARWLQDNLKPLGVGVVIEATHTCMTVRGVGAIGTTAVTSAFLGSIRADARTRAEFLSLAGHVGHGGPA